MNMMPGEYDNPEQGSSHDTDWGGVVNYLTNPAVNVPPNRVAGAHMRWSQSLVDNGSVRSSYQTSMMSQASGMYGAQPSFEGGVGAAREQGDEHVGDAEMDQDAYGEGMQHGG